MNKKLLISILLLYSCNNNSDQTERSFPLAKPPVTITSVSIGTMHTELEFNAYSKYLRRELVHAPLAGYLTKVMIRPGERVTRGKVLFRVQTPEARALSESGLRQDNLSETGGMLSVKASKNGIINNVMYQEGAYVPQGELLADIIQTNSISFIMNVPYATTSVISKSQPVEIQMPDGSILQTHVGDPLPTTSLAEQVQSYILLPDSLFFIPENLNALAKVKVRERKNVSRIDKQAVLANETQTHFWIMKLINDTTAIKVAIRKGQEMNDWIEVISPSFSPEDRILLTGQYGLPDTAYVDVVKQ